MMEPITTVNADLLTLNNSQVKARLDGWFKLSFFTEFYDDAVPAIIEVNSIRGEDDKLVLILNFTENTYAIHEWSDFVKISMDRISGKSKKKKWVQDLGQIISAIGYLPLPIYEKLNPRQHKKSRKILVYYKALISYPKRLFHRLGIIALSKKN